MGMATTAGWESVMSSLKAQRRSGRVGERVSGSGKGDEVEGAARASQDDVRRPDSETTMRGSVDPPCEAQGTVRTAGARFRVEMRGSAIETAYGACRGAGARVRVRATAGVRGSEIEDAGAGDGVETGGAGAATMAGPETSTGREGRDGSARGAL